jgi:capsular polysaccharide biosynthesis protein
MFPTASTQVQDCWQEMWPYGEFLLPQLKEMLQLKNLQLLQERAWLKIMQKTLWMLSLVCNKLKLPWKLQAIPLRSQGNKGD